MKRSIVPLMTLMVTLIAQRPLMAADPAGDPVVSFIKTTCLDCHSGEAAEANFDLESLVKNDSRESLEAAATFDVWAMVHQRVTNGEMPPQDADQPKLDDKTKFLSALGGGLAAWRMLIESGNSSLAAANCVGSVELSMPTR